MQGEIENNQTSARNCLAAAVKDRKTCSINTLETKGGLRRVPVFYWRHGAGRIQGKTEVLHASICGTKTSCSLSAELPELEEKEEEENKAPII